MPGDRGNRGWSKQGHTGACLVGYKAEVQLAEAFAVVAGVQQLPQAPLQLHQALLVPSPLPRQHFLPSI